MQPFFVSSVAENLCYLTLKKSRAFPGLMTGLCFVLLVWVIWVFKVTTKSDMHWVGDEILLSFFAFFPSAGLYWNGYGGRTLRDEGYMCVCKGI